MIRARYAVYAIFCLGLAACAQGDDGRNGGIHAGFPPVRGEKSIDETSIMPGYRPELETMEGGIWSQVEKLEEATKTSGKRVTDENLNAYISKIVCDLAGTYCPDIRLYIIENPTFNASMFPNGMMHVNTGFLLRIQSEAQMATVFGHEIGHYLKRHSLKRTQDKHVKANAFVFVQIGFALVNAAPLGDLIRLALQGSISAYSRDQEREADSIGLDLMVKEGYSPGAAPEIWENLFEEGSKASKGLNYLFFGSHPLPSERIESLRRQAEAMDLPVKQRIGETTFLEMIAPFREGWFQQQLSQESFKESKVVLKNMAPSPLYPGELHFLRGELIRREREKDFVPRAIEYYQKAIEMDPDDSRPYKAIGLLLMKTKQKERARTNFHSYLSHAPQAVDRGVIEQYLKELDK
ncbi:MAG: M48 family metalloprotease [Alphaproteobacteria bacterium]|jgi:predicted Zn-dependent protease|nr:M48 family metalloprotease [Alphaproteobacteria bacterium]